MCGLPFVRSNIRRTICIPCEREKQRIKNKRYYEKKKRG